MPVFDSLDELRRWRPDLAEAPVYEVAFPGEMRDRLLPAYLDGTKTAASCLWSEYEMEGAALPAPGRREVIVDSALRPVAVLEIVAADRVRLVDVDARVALAEGEGFRDVADWRREHERFWTSVEMRELLGDPGFAPTDDTEVVITVVPGGRAALGGH